MDCQCKGRKLRQELALKVSAAKKRPEKELDSSKKLNVSLGAGQEKEWGLSKLTERERRSPEWSRVAKGGLRVIPVVEFRLNSLPKSKDGVVDFQTKTRNMRVIDSYPVHLQEDDMVKEMKEQFDRFKEKGATDKEATDNLFKTKKKEYEALQSWKDTKAEIATKEAFEKLFENLGIPSLLVRTVDYKALSLQELGLDTPAKKREMDLLLAYVLGKDLHISLCEVKRPRAELWESPDKEPTKESIKEALSQLLADIDLMCCLLPDIPGTNIILNTLSCFPYTPLHVLENTFCITCMKYVLGKEDLLELDRLREKLEVPSDLFPAPSWTEGALENLLKLNTRLAGQHSLLHIGWREMEDVGKLEAGRMENNVRSVERVLGANKQTKKHKGKYVFSTPQQQEAIEVAHRKGSARHLTVMGRAGSGKTIILLGFVAEHMKQPVKKKLLILAAYRQYDKDRIVRYLKSEAKCPLDGMIVMGWEDLLNHFEIDRTRRIQRKDAHGNEVLDTPAIISSLSEAAAKRFPGHQIVVAIDEIDASYAPLTTDGEKNDWSKIEVPDTVSLALVFNPGSIRHPMTMSLSTDPSFHHVSCDLRFRSTRSITDVIDCVAEHSGQGLRADPDKPDRLSTDVVGVIPSIVDLGKLNHTSDLVDALDRIRISLGEERRYNVVLLYDRCLCDSPGIIKEVLDTAHNANWQTFLSGAFTGSEADTVVFVGPGGLEPLSRARLRLCVVLMWDTEWGKKKYERYLPGFKRAISEKLMTTC